MRREIIKKCFLNMQLIKADEKELLVNAWNKGCEELNKYRGMYVLKEKCEDGFLVLSLLEEALLKFDHVSVIFPQDMKYVCIVNYFGEILKKVIKEKASFKIWIKTQRDNIDFQKYLMHMGLKWSNYRKTSSESKTRLSSQGILFNLSGDGKLTSTNSKKKFEKADLPEYIIEKNTFKEKKPKTKKMVKHNEPEA